VPFFQRSTPPTPPSSAPPSRPRPFRPHTVPLLLAPDGREAVVVDGEYLTRWDLAEVGAEPAGTHRRTGAVTQVVGNGRLLVWGDASGAVGPKAVVVRRWADFSEVRAVELPAALISALDVSPDGARIAVGDAQERITLVEVATGRTVPVPEADGGGHPSGLRWSPDGTVLAAVQVGQGGGSLDLHRVRPDGSTAESVRMEPGVDEGLADAVASIEFGPDGRSVYCSFAGGVSSLARIDADTGRVVWTRPLDLSLAGTSDLADAPGGVLSVSHDGRLVLHGNEAGELLAFAAATGRLVHRAPLLTVGPLVWLTASPSEPEFWVALDAIPQQYPLPAVA
jgi:hypothetical protein